MHLFVFGNGNISLSDFVRYYEIPLRKQMQETLQPVHIHVCDFRGVDTLVMELLKTETPHVHVYHIGDKPRYMPDHFRTFVNQWQWIGGFKTDTERDVAVMEKCTHFLGIDFNSDANRKSGTQKNIEKCRALNKIEVRNEALF